MRMAEQAPSQEAKRVLLDLAWSWTRLASELEDAKPVLDAMRKLEPKG
jgi:hypothetical protein